MVTPEMLLFLLERMGKKGHIAMSRVWIQPDMAHSFNPATDDAQFGRLVVWAAMNRVMLEVWPDSVQAAVSCKMGSHTLPHDSTPDSIRAAAVVAIARALGWEGQE